MPDSEATRLWRDHAKLNLSVSWKADVDKTITDIELWREILENNRYQLNGKWKWKSWAIKPLLDTYERMQFDRDAIQQKRSGVHCSEGLPERTTRRMPESPMPVLYAGKRL